MANLVKYKAALSATSIVIIGLFYGMLNSFHLNPQERPWSDSISWSDFKGYSHFFNEYDAGIDSEIKLEYDSSTSQCKAKALMNQSNSWYKGNVDRLSNDLLKHEQYHFNLTEAFARLMNTYINDYPDSSLRFYQTKLVQIEHELGRLQEVYDDETNHSLLVDQQAKWEYKIDSMLWVNSGMQPSVDPYSGVSAFFPVVPKFESFLTTEKKIVRHFSYKRQDIILSITIIQDYETLFMDSIHRLDIDVYSKMNIVVNSNQILNRNRMLIQASNLTNAYYDLWHYEYPNTYIISCTWNSEAQNSKGFRAIAKSFVNSFATRNTENYWLEKFGDSNFVHRNDRNKSVGVIDKICFKETYVGGHFGFIKGPIESPNSGILFAVDFTIPDSIKDKNFGVLSDMDLAIEMIPPENKVYYFFKEDVQNDSVVHLCYTRKNDPNPSCPKLFCQTLPLRR